jgi:hypothetical protein
MTKSRIVRIPKNIVDSIDIIVKNYKELGYRNHKEFIIDTIKMRLESLKEDNNESND